MTNVTTFFSITILKKFSQWDIIIIQMLNFSLFQSLTNFLLVSLLVKFSKRHICRGTKQAFFLKKPHGILNIINRIKFVCLYKYYQSYYFQVPERIVLSRCLYRYYQQDIAHILFARSPHPFIQQPPYPPPCNGAEPSSTNRQLSILSNCVGGRLQQEERTLYWNEIKLWLET